MTTSDDFTGQVWCITGSFEQFRPRTLAAEEIRKRGGLVVSAIGRTTTHLLAGTDSGSKLKRAEDREIKVVREAEFLDLLSATRTEASDARGSRLTPGSRGGPTGTVEGANGRYTVVGSEGDVYDVVISRTRWSCNCQAGSFGTLCHHVREAATVGHEIAFIREIEKLDELASRAKAAKSESLKLFERWRREPTNEYFEAMDSACSEFRTAKKMHDLAAREMTLH